jgi:hypothetical protein
MERSYSTPLLRRRTFMWGYPLSPTMALSGWGLAVAARLGCRGGNDDDNDDDDDGREGKKPSLEAAAALP